MNYYPLRELADVETGITLRGKESSRHNPEGTHRLIRISDVSLDGVLTAGSSSLIRLSEQESAKFGLKPGNILLAARGSRLTASVFEVDEPAVAGGQFLVIRIPSHRRALSPGFLAWYLNLPGIQEELSSRMRGTYIRSLPARTLANLQVPVPAIEKQFPIEELCRFRIREKELMEQLAQKRGLLIDQLATQSINHSRHFNHVLG